jgi:glycosyltransferase involved in cell wall biosynthesis
VNAARAEILPNTFDASEFAPAPRSVDLLARYGLRPDQTVLLTVARLDAHERYKGIDEMLGVLPAVLKAVPDTRYLILGQGTDRPRLEQLVRDLGLERSVTFGNNVPRGELCAHYNLCDLFAMPSRGEGFGIVFLEALACGRPVLAGSGDGSRDPLRDGELGVLVDPGNAAALGETVVAVLRKQFPHPNLYRPAFLREQVISHFGHERFRRTLESLLQDFFADRATTH